MAVKHKAMTWTKQIPKESGWYWVKWTRFGHEIVEPGLVCTDREIIETQSLGSLDYQTLTLAQRDGWLFAGPIPEPENGEK